MNKYMINDVTLAFLKAVKENNNLEWMNQNRDLYHMQRDNFFDFAKKLIDTTKKIDKKLGNIPVKDCTFRFNKDIRFTKDKSPYKTNFGVIIREEGKHGNGAGYYVHIQPGECFVGGGMYMPPSATLQRVRAKISKNHKQLQKIITAPLFQKTFGKLQGKSLQNIPRGFDKQHKAGELLKMKSWFVGHTVTDKQVTQEDFVQYCLKIFTVMKPLNDFLNK